MKCYYDTYFLKNLIKLCTCYKNPENPTCINLMLTNVPVSFHITLELEADLIDFHFNTLAFMRKGCTNFQSRINSYRSYKNFSNENFRANLLHNLWKANLVKNVDGFRKLGDVGFEALNKYTPCRKKHAQSNQMHCSIKSSLKL